MERLCNVNKLTVSTVMLLLLVITFQSTSFANATILKAQKIAKEQQEAKERAARQAAAKRAKATLRTAARERARAQHRVKTAMLNMIRRTKDRSQGCVNCHALPHMNGRTATPSQMRLVQRQVPNHSTQGFSNCLGCHITGWKTPDRNMDFRGKTNNELCIMLNTPTRSHPTMRDHLEGDRLIAWAISGAAFPDNNRGRPDARDRSNENRQIDWITNVRRWVAAHPDGTPEGKCSGIR